MIMKKNAIAEIDLLIERYPALAKLYPQLLHGAELIAQSYRNGKKILVCGNGGSAADSLHIVGELMKRFVIKRELKKELKERIAEDYPENAAFYLKYLEGTLPAISLVNEVSLMTAYSNDQAAELAFAQQVLGYGEKGDVLIVISTSGNSENVLHAAKIAHSMGIHVLAMTGETGGKLKAYSDVLLNVPSTITYQIQEYHLPIYHALCLAMEKEFFEE